MIPCYFGPSQSQLFGAFDAAATPRLRRAVLILNPGGWEYVRAHRTLRLLAARLSAVGIDAMRFDYSGTGDSWGDSDSAVTLERWIQDVEDAADELMALAGVARIGMVGLRLGARVALESLRRTTLPCDRLVLWDPTDFGGSPPSVGASLKGDGAHDLALPDLASSMRVPAAVLDALARDDRAREVRAGVATIVALSDGGVVPADLDALQPQQTLRRPGSMPCWVEERDFGAGAVPSALIDDIVACLQS